MVLNLIAYLIFQILLRYNLVSNFFFKIIEALFKCLTNRASRQRFQNIG